MQHTANKTFPRNETPAWLQHLQYEWRCNQAHTRKMAHKLAVAEKRGQSYSQENSYRVPSFQAHIQAWEDWRTTATAKRVAERTDAEHDAVHDLYQNALKSEKKWMAQCAKFRTLHKKWARRVKKIQKTPLPKGMWDEERIMSEIRNELQKLNESKGTNVVFNERTGKLTFSSVATPTAAAVMQESITPAPQQKAANTSFFSQMFRPLFG